MQAVQHRAGQASFLFLSPPGRLAGMVLVPASTPRLGLFTHAMDQAVEPLVDHSMDHILRGDIK